MFGKSSVRQCLHIFPRKKRWFPRWYARRCRLVAPGCTWCRPPLPPSRCRPPLPPSRCRPPLPPSRCRPPLPPFQCRPPSPSVPMQAPSPSIPRLRGAGDSRPPTEPRASLAFPSLSDGPSQDMPRLARTDTRVAPLNCNCLEFGVPVSGPRLVAHDLLFTQERFQVNKRFDECF
jgi:hypothetical protein